MAYDRRLAERVRSELERYKGVGEIKMFGGLCFTLRGNMLVGVLKDELMVRLPKEEDTPTSREPHVRPMDFTGRRMKGFHFVRSSGLRTSAQLRRWVERGVAYVSTLPRPESPFYCRTTRVASDPVKQRSKRIRSRFAPPPRF